MTTYNMRYLRKVRGLTQDDLAKTVGANRETVGRWERGEKTPGQKNREKIAKALGVDCDQVDWYPAWEKGERVNTWANQYTDAKEVLKHG